MGQNQSLRALGDDVGEGLGYLCGHASTHAWDAIRTSFVWLVVRVGVLLMADVLLSRNLSDRLSNGIITTLRRG